MYYYENRNREAYRCYRGPVQNAPAHFHSQAELCLMLSGTLTFTACEKQYRVGCGDVFVIFPYQIHRYDDIDGTGEILQLTADHRLTPEYHKTFTELWPASPLLPRDAGLPILRRLANELPDLYACRQNGPYGEITLRGCFIAVWGEVLSELKLEKSAVRPDYGLFQNAIRFCVENFSHPSVTLEKTAKVLNVNRAYLSALFSRNLCCGFHTYLNHLRIIRVCYLIAEESSSITEAAFSSGFTNLRTFNRVFMKQVGMTPTAYRKSAGQGCFTLAPPSDTMPI